VVLDQVEDGWIRVVSLVKEPNHSRDNQYEDHTDDDQSREKRTVLWRRITKTRLYIGNYSFWTFCVLIGQKLGKPVYRNTSK